MAKRSNVPIIRGLKAVNNVLAGYFSEYIIMEDGRIVYGKPTNPGCRVKAIIKNDEVANLYPLTYHESALLKSFLNDIKVTKATMKDKIDCIDFKLFETTDVENTKPYDVYRIKKVKKHGDEVILLPGMAVEPLFEEIFGDILYHNFSGAIGRPVTANEINALANKEFVTIEGVLLGKNELPSIEKANEVVVYTVGTDHDKDYVAQFGRPVFDYYGDGNYENHYIVFDIDFEEVRVLKLLQYGFSIQSI